MAGGGGVPHRWASITGAVSPFGSACVGCCGMVGAGAGPVVGFCSDGRGAGPMGGVVGGAGGCVPRRRVSITGAASAFGSAWVGCCGMVGAGPAGGFCSDGRGAGPTDGAVGGAGGCVPRRRVSITGAVSAFGSVWAGCCGMVGAGPAGGFGSAGRGAGPMGAAVGGAGCCAPLRRASITGTVPALGSAWVGCCGVVGAGAAGGFCSVGRGAGPMGAAVGGAGGCVPLRRFSITGEVPALGAAWVGCCGVVGAGPAVGFCSVERGAGPTDGPVGGAGGCAPRRRVSITGVASAFSGVWAGCCGVVGADPAGGAVSVGRGVGPMGGAVGGAGGCPPGGRVSSITGRA